jgi:hypothetical protein
MLRLCSESSRSYTPQGGTILSPWRSVRLAVAPCGSALYGNMQGDRAAAVAFQAMASQGSQPLVGAKLEERRPKVIVGVGRRRLVVR